MSSVAVRELVLDFLDTEATSESVVDLTAEYAELKKMLTDAGVQPDAPWLGVQFVGDSEIPVSLSATNDQGLYRETGSVVLHVCSAARLGVGNSISQRGQALHNLFRGLRIGAFVVDEIIPLNTGPGSTLEFEGGYVSGTMTIIYHYDLNL